MRNMFAAWYPRTPEECAAKFQDCVFSFDTNVLLNLYRYSPRMRGALFDTLRVLKGRAWLTHQVAKEYHKLRIDAILKLLKTFDESIADFKKAISALEEKRKGARSQLGKIIQPIQEAYRTAIEAVTKQKEAQPNLLKSDIILEFVTNLFDGMVGEPFSEKEYKEKSKQAKERFDNKRPPGFLDEGKPEPDRYHDAIIWFQLLDFAKTDTRPLVFVTDENDEDWWDMRQPGKRIGPRIELIEEMLTEANGKWFHMYSTEQFLRFMQVAPEVMSETESIKQDDAFRGLRDMKRDIRQRQQFFAQPEFMTMRASLLQAIKAGREAGEGIFNVSDAELKWLQNDPSLSDEDGIKARQSLESRMSSVEIQGLKIALEQE